jgi:transcription termination factor Rho
MDIRELKTMDAPGLVRLAGTFAIENAGVLRRQELVYRIIQAQARKNGQLVADGVLEIVSEGSASCGRWRQATCRGPTTCSSRPSKFDGSAS